MCCLLCYRSISFVRIFDLLEDDPNWLVEVLGVATAVLHNKPTKDNSLGSKVEFAMDLVRLDPCFEVTRLMRSRVRLCFQ
jgi:hypothetical protein